MSKKSDNASKSLFDHLNQIRTEKRPDYYDKLTETEKKGFGQFVILTGLSMDRNCIEEVALLSKYMGLIPDKQFYKLCCDLIPYTQKFSRWIKSGKDKTNTELIGYIAKYYEIGSEDALDYYNLMIQCEKIEEINHILSKYGLTETEIKGLMK